MTERQERDFHAGIIEAGDPILERRLALGASTLRAVVSILTAQPSARDVAMASPIDDVAAFDGSPSHLAIIERLCALADSAPADRRGLHMALVEYGCQLALEGCVACARAVLSLSEWARDATCSDEAGLEALYRDTLIMVRGARPLSESRHLPVLLAVRARRARSTHYLLLARVVFTEHLTYRGTLSAARASALRLLRRASAAGDADIVANAYLRLSIIEGRSGNHTGALHHARKALLADSPDRLLHQNAYYLMGRSLVDCDLLDDARHAFELADAPEYSPLQMLVFLGLMELALRTQDWSEFERLDRRVSAAPMLAAHRTTYLKLCALERAAAGDISGAIRKLEEGLALARKHGFGFENYEFDAELEKYRTSVAPAQLDLDVIADVTAELAVRHRQFASTT